MRNDLPIIGLVYRKNKFGHHYHLPADGHGISDLNYRVRLLSGNETCQQSGSREFLRAEELLTRGWYSTILRYQHWTRDPQLSLCTSGLSLVSVSRTVWSSVRASCSWAGPGRCAGWSPALLLPRNTGAADQQPLQYSVHTVEKINCY